MTQAAAHYHYTMIVDFDAKEYTILISQNSISSSYIYDQTKDLWQQTN